MTEPSDAPGELSAPAAAAPLPPVAPPSTIHEPEPSAARRIFWQGKLTPAFWTIAGIISLTVNIILLVALIILGTQIFNVRFMV